MFDTYIGLFEHRVSEYGHATALRYRGEDNWESISWREWWLESERFAAALIEYGVNSADRVAIVSETRFEWLVADVACMMIGAIPTALFPTIVASQFEKTIRDAKPRAVVLEGPAQLERFLECESTCELVILLDRISTFIEPDTSGRTIIQLDDLDTEKFHGDVVLYDAFMATGRRAHSQSATLLAERRLAIDTDDIATIVYTSGTTADGRGVVITHRNIVSQIESIMQLELIRPREMHLLTLPLAHIFARVLLWVSVAGGVETALGTGLHTIVRDAAEIQPHAIATVPSLLEHFRRGLRRDLRRFGSLRERALDGIWSAGFSLDAVDRLKKTIGAQLARNSLERLFGTRLRAFISGGAKVDAQLADFFERIGVNVVEGYGLVETTGIVAVGRPNKTESGTVGFPIPKVDVTLGENSEIWVRGDVVAPGYYNHQGPPDAILNPEGWFQTGDIGSIDERGQLRVLGRLNDEIVTSGGRKVSPRGIEIALEQSTDIESAFVLGDGRPYVVALLVVAEDDEACRERVAEHVRLVNSEIATTATIRRFEIVHEHFSFERGEVTANGKLRRDALVRTRHEAIEHMYR